MKTPFRRLRAGLVLLLAVFLLVGEGAPENSIAQARLERLEIVTDSGTRVFHVEVAETNAERRRGLMERENLPEDGGMLFLFEPPQRVSMWMKNTWIPLDMLFIDADGIIRYLAPMRMPGDLRPVGPPAPMQTVLEIAGGRAEELGIEVGDRVFHPYLR